MLGTLGYPVYVGGLWYCEWLLTGLGEHLLKGSSHEYRA